MTLQEALATLLSGCATKDELGENDFVPVFNTTTQTMSIVKLKDIIAKYSGYKSFMEAGYNEEEVLNLIDEVIEE